MSTPSCVGPEFKTGTPTLTIANARPGAWPYGSCAQGSNNGLRRDPTGGLWVEPGLYGTVNDLTNAALDNTINIPPGATYPFPDLPLTLTNPANVPIQIMLWTRMQYNIFEYDSTGQIKNYCFVGTGTIPSPTTWNGFSSPANPAVASGFRVGVQPWYSHAVVATRHALNPGQSLVLHRQQGIFISLQTGSGGDTVEAQRQQAKTTGFWFSNAQPT